MKGLDILLLILLTIGAIVFIVGLVLVIIAFVQKKSIKRPLVVIGSSVALLAIALFGIVQYQAHVDQVKAEQRAEEKAELKRDNKKFDSAYGEFIAYAYLNAHAAESLGNEVSNTWNSAIFDDGGATVDGKKYTDFNDAIQALLTSKSADVSSIDSGESDMASSIAKMEKYKSSSRQAKFDKAKKMQSAVKKLDRLATSPTGNLSSYNSAFSDADSGVANLISD